LGLFRIVVFGRESKEFTISVILGYGKFATMMSIEHVFEEGVQGVREANMV
jgi:hypothetical protein